jgi:uncharacterized protein YfcZ (UPF0381/DUF406 family)
MRRLLPRSLIAEIVCGLLERCQDCNCSPGPELVGLIRELLDVQSYKQGAPREFDDRERAISILAQIRELARQVDVNPTTVSRWRHSPTERATLQTADIARRLMRGAEMHQETGSW